ncbi:hypothetical protein L6452_00374 [Arctium lappa]|uniref:Uncharacterized protein n=1 Tax=Arctium lappa TaxID=4217 RepID=A0ACB9FEC2_ARCLA|nr:hypothetical protein L6452_00374 [Arctium lappa]
MEQICEREQKPSMEPNQCGSWWSGYNNIQSVWKLVEEKPSPSSARTHIQPNTKTIYLLEIGPMWRFRSGFEVGDQCDDGGDHHWRPSVA